MHRGDFYRYSLRKVPLFFMFLVIIFSALAPPLLASGDPLSPDDVKALNQYPNWVANNCGTVASPTATPTNGSVVWPFATKDHTQYNRIDQGWDIQDQAGAGVYAIAPGTINTYQPDPGGFGNDYPVEHLDSSIGGPSDWVYYGHVHIIPSLKGQHVDAGQPIAHANTTDGENGSAAPPGWLEIGFAQPNTDAPVQVGGETVATQAGQQMHDILINAQPSTGGGAVTDPGNQAGNCCPNGGGGGGSVTLTGSNNEEKAYNYFVSQGLTPQQAAGIFGNLMLESAGTMNPEVVEGGGTSPTPTGGGWGIAQWTPGTGITAIASAAHITDPVNQLSTQLDIIWAELTGKAGINDESQVLRDIRSTNTVKDAVLAFQGDQNVGGKYIGFERPADEAGSVPQRVTYALQALNKYGGGGGAVGGGGGCSGPAVSPSGYQNPLRDWNNLSPNRVDQGVDYSGVGPIYAIGNGTIDFASTSVSWPGGNFVSYKLSDGPAAGKEVYVAEDCALESGISHGKSVTATTVLCKTSATGGNIWIETGWAAPVIDNAIDASLPTACYDINNSTSTAYGMNFRDLMISLGVKPGNEVDKPITCSLPSGWPTWQ